MTQFDPRHFVFMDLEASAFGPGSWPVEVGLAWITPEGIESWSSLIRPDQTWSLDPWSDESAQVHGIRYDELLKAPRAEDVLLKTKEKIARRTPVVTHPKHDNYWFNRMTELEESSKPIMAIGVMELSEMSDMDFWALMDFAEKNDSHTHRAGQDAAFLARAAENGWRSATNSVQSGWFPQ